MKQVIVAFSLAFLTACSGMGYAIENYAGTKAIQFQHDGQRFRVYDKPAENRLMITPSFGRASLQGATFGGAATAEMTYELAAQAYLTSTGRECEISDLKLIVQPQYEAFYLCR